MSQIRVLLCFLLLIGCSELPDPTNTNDIDKSPNDDRSYRYLQLDNGLQAVLVSDPEADKAAAALDVFVGSAQDPRDRQGLAHFLEHMLFLGTDKHPEPGEYQAFISEHGGAYNAYTSFRHTNYFFDINPDYFDAGLERFSRFFVAPLFNEDYVEREKNAVHSEYQARIKNDYRRQYDVFQQLANPANPASTFSVGSLETLADRPDAPVREALLRFYHNYYSADRMALTLVAPESLDALESKVRKLFAEVPKRDAAPIVIEPPLFAPGTLPALVRIEPIQEIRELSLIFPVADDREFYREKPLSYLGNLLGHEGEGSLLALLKARGYAEGLSAGEALSDGRHAAFQIAIDLTPAGQAHWQNVVQLVFAQIELIRDSGVAKWRHRQQGSLAAMHFRFQEKVAPMNYASQLAGRLHDYPVTDVLRGPFRMDRYNSARIRSILGALTPANVLVTLTAPDVATDRESPFYQVPYSVTQLSSETLAQWREAGRDTALQLPEPNPYIPEDFALIEAPEKSKPQLLEERLWYAPDIQFGVPKVQLRAAFQSPLINTVAGAAKIALLLSVIEDNLNAEAYPAALAGLSYSFDVNPDGFGFSVGGFGDKIPVLLDKIVGRLQAPRLEEAVVARVRAELIRNWRNTTKSEPYRRVWAKVPEILQATDYDPLQLAAALESVSLAELRAFAVSLFDSSRLTLLAGGNLSEQRARQLVQPVAALADQNAQPGASHRQVARVEQAQTHEIDLDHNDTALIRYYQGRSATLEEQARFMVLRQLIKAPFFNDLRTEQQLGYVVAAVDVSLDRMPGIGLLVQSPVADSNAIENAIEDFLNTFAEQLAGMNDTDLASYRTAVITNLKEKPKNLGERIARDWYAIDLQHYEFDIREQLIEAVSTYTVEDARRDFSAVFLHGGQWLEVVGEKPTS